MDLNSIKSSTYRECQRHLFIQSLYKELDKAAATADARNDRLSRRASHLLFDEKLTKDACVESLMLEGFSGEQARVLVESMTPPKESETDSVNYKYDYVFEDHRGRIFSGRELGEFVEASSDDEAHSVVKKVLSSFDPPVDLISITRVS